MTILIADNTGLLDGAVITEVVSGGGEYVAHRAWDRGTVWHVSETRHDEIVQTYPDAPGMNALVALRRYLVERERENRERRTVHECPCGVPDCWCDGDDCR